MWDEHLRDMEVVMTSGEINTLLDIKITRNIIKSWRLFDGMLVTNLKQLLK